MMRINYNLSFMEQLADRGCTVLRMSCSIIRTINQECDNFNQSWNNVSSIDPENSSVREEAMIDIANVTSAIQLGSFELHYCINLLMETSESVSEIRRSLDNILMPNEDSIAAAAAEDIAAAAAEDLAAADDLAAAAATSTLSKPLDLGNVTTGEAFRCKICLEHPVELLFLPCKHLCVCLKCWLLQEHDNCIICRKNVDRTISFYM